MDRRRAIWSELVPYARLATREVLGLLAERDLALYLAVTPAHDGLERVLAACRERGIAVALWPMLSHAEGRWPCDENAGRFRAFTLSLLDRLAAHDLVPEGIAIDLEPPIAELSRLLALDGGAIRRRTFRATPPGSIAELARLRDALEERGIEVFAAAFPFVIEGAGWQRFLGTPVDALGACRVTAMIYTSMIEGYARGHLGRRDALAVLHRWARVLAARPSASVSLGCVGPGILGDEPTYRGPEELAADVSATRAAGVDDLVLFSLGGVLSRPPAERWLDAFVESTASEEVPATPRALAVLAAVRAAGVLLELTGRRRAG